MSDSTLSESRDAHVQLLLAHVPVVMFVTDRDDTILHAEGHRLQHLALTPDDFIARPVADVCRAFFPQDTQHILDTIHGSLAGETFTVTGLV